MRRTSSIIIGGGQAGLAMSRCLSDLGVDHVVLERGEVGNRWRTHGWDSLRLLTPNWMTRLPGFRYEGNEPDEFMRVAEVVDLLVQYARSFQAPVVSQTNVQGVERLPGGYQVTTNHDTWRAETVVIATGHCDLPFVPATSQGLPPWVTQITPDRYRHPEQLPLAGVLVVGASATGIQLAEEIHRSGRPVTLAVGRHTRLPRIYRGHDILWWFDQLGLLRQDVGTVHDVSTSRNQPSLQLVGRPDHATLDLQALAAAGVRLVGHVLRTNGRHVKLDDDLAATAAAADYKLASIRRRIDEFITATGTTALAPEPFVPTWPLGVNPQTELDLEHDNIRTVIWATGYRRAYPWLHVPVLDARGDIRHDGGITAQPGLYVLGLNFLRRRNSSFIDGVGDDARYVANHLTSRLAAARIA